MPNRYQWAAISFLFGVMFACHACMFTRSGTNTPEPRPLLSAEDYAAETKDLQEALDSATNTTDTAASHLALAWIYVAHNNPLRDYDKALVHLIQYGRIDPEGAVDMRVNNWIAVLDTVKSLTQTSGLQQTALQATIDRQQIQLDQLRKQVEQSGINKQQIQLDQLRQQVRQSGAELSQADKRANDLRRRQRDLQKKIAALEAENQSLRETIEKLKTLDLFLEQKERELKHPSVD
jgi:hypothetical protein